MFSRISPISSSLLARGAPHACNAATASRLLAARFSSSAAAAASDKKHTLDLTLYQFEGCPFCCKVKAVMDFYKLPYRTVEVHPRNKKQIEFSKEYKKVPILLLKDSKQGEETSQQINESDVIVERLRTLAGEYGLVPQEKLVKTQVDEEMGKWINENFLKLMAVYMYRTPASSYDSLNFLAVHPHFNPFQRVIFRYAGSLFLWAIHKKVAKTRQVTDPEGAMKGAMQEWTAKLSSRKFIGGEKPSLADIKMYGVMTPLNQMQALSELFKAGPPEFKEWYNRVKAEVGEPARVSAE